MTFPLLLKFKSYLLLFLYALELYFPRHDLGGGETKPKNSNSIIPLRIRWRERATQYLNRWTSHFQPVVCSYFCLGQNVTSDLKPKENTDIVPSGQCGFLAKSPETALFFRNYRQSLHELNLFITGNFASLPSTQAATVMELGTTASQTINSSTCQPPAGIITM